MISSVLDLSPATDSTLLRAAFGAFPTGVAAISVAVDDEPLVVVASSFQVGISLDPPLVLFAVQHTSTSWPRIRQAAHDGAHLGVSVLAEEHRDITRQLASRTGDRFTGVATSTNAHRAHFVLGSPVLMDCTVHAEVPAGDHDVVLLRIHELQFTPDVEPLVWHSSAFRVLAPRWTA